MVQVSCPGEFGYVAIGAVVDGAYSPNDPMTPGMGIPVVINTRNSIKAEQGRHTVEVRVYISPVGSNPNCSLDDFEVDYTKYFL
jgi:hypothetical protein